MSAKAKSGRSVDAAESVDATLPKSASPAALFERTMKRYPKTMARLAE